MSFFGLSLYNTGSHGVSPDWGPSFASLSLPGKLCFLISTFNRCSLASQKLLLPFPSHKRCHLWPFLKYFYCTLGCTRGCMCECMCMCARVHARATTVHMDVKAQLVGIGSLLLPRESREWNLTTGVCYGMIWILRFDCPSLVSFPSL